MGIQRNTRITEQVAKTLEMFADLVEGGMLPEDAVNSVAAQLQAEQQPTTLGNTANAMDIQNMVSAGSPQAAQMGTSSE